ncbi:hypothetical protein ACFLIM_48315 [Nonomuraea sp. M3C6]|uniref:Uncharacterized protein n=1 Tax=Nonomuraea marmarensis TaxID=3351344 RepID=A0ABW7AU79_9ACTN
MITNVATTDATVPDTAMTATIHQHLARRGLLPAEHYLDAGYSSAELIVAAREQHQTTVQAYVRYAVTVGERRLMTVSICCCVSSLSSWLSSDAWCGGCGLAPI